MTDKKTIRLGESASNTTDIMSKLGFKVKRFGGTGSGDWSDISINAMNSSGVDTNNVLQDDRQKTGLTSIQVVQNGEHVLFSFLGAKRNILPEWI